MFRIIASAAHVGAIIPVLREIRATDPGASALRTPGTGDTRWVVLVHTPETIGDHCPECGAHSATLDAYDPNRPFRGAVEVHWSTHRGCVACGSQPKEA